jgi:APA family basic amino acid/polyamine antiporter
MANATDGQMGIWMTSALVVGTMIGAGIFMLPGALAPLGANAALGWIVSGMGSFAIAFSLAVLSRLGGDGIQANIERQLGPDTAFILAWAFWISNWTAQAAVALAGASALSWFNDQLSGQGFVIPVAIGSVVAFTAVNAQGARAAGGASIVTVVIKLVPLFAVMAIFARRGSVSEIFEHFAPVPISIANVATAVTLTFAALTGFESATTPVGKVRSASRTIPLAMLGGTLFVACLYLFACTSVQLLLPTSQIVDSPAPFAAVIAGNWSVAAASLAAIAIAVAAFGCLNGLILGTGELGYAMGLRGDLPAFMLWTRGDDTPIGAQVFGSLLTIALILTNSSRATANLFTFAILLSTSAILLVYFGGAVSALGLSKGPLSRATIVIALGFILFAFYGAGVEANLWCGGLVAIGLMVRVLTRKRVMSQ